jgi:hypothetical protein
MKLKFITSPLRGLTKFLKTPVQKIKGRTRIKEVQEEIDSLIKINQVIHKSRDKFKFVLDDALIPFVLVDDFSEIFFMNNEFYSTFVRNTSLEAVYPNIADIISLKTNLSEILSGYQNLFCKNKEEKSETVPCAHYSDTIEVEINGAIFLTKCKRVDSYTTIVFLEK